MDDNVDYAEYQPGHLHLRLNINKYENDDVFDDEIIQDRRLSPEEIHRREENLRNTRIRDLTFRYNSVTTALHEEDIPDVPAALNLLGVLAYRLGKLNDATEHFEAALKKDDGNVNAIQNLAKTYSGLNEPEKAGTWSNKVQKLLGRSTQNISDKQVNHRMACSLAEQAYAHAYDVSLMHYHERKQKLDTAIRMYDRAINIGASSITLPERRRWYFVMATIFVRIDTLMSWSREPEKARLPGFNRAVNLLKEVAKSELLYHKALAWAYIGILLERQTSFETTPMAIHDCGFTGTEPLDSYSKAIQLAENQPNVLNRLAKVFLLLKKHELAIGTITMAVDMSDNQAMKVASCHSRAKIHASVYIKDLTLSKMGSSTMPDRTLLEKAKQDLERVSNFAPSLRTFMDLGQVCYYMGVDAIKESFVVNEDYVNKALNYFAKALDCEMGEGLPELQLLRGKCLRVKGEERNALECFKRAIEMDREGSRNTQAFRCLLETLVVWYSQGGESRRDVIINDVDKWLRLALEKFNHDVIVSELRSLLHIYTHETLELCKGTIKVGKMTLAKLYFSIFPPSAPNNSPELETHS